MGGQRSRWLDADSDEGRLPPGMTRVSYDADTQTFSYQDADGSFWRGEPGARYGTLHRCGEASSTRQMMSSGSTRTMPRFLPCDDEEVVPGGADNGGANNGGAEGGETLSRRPSTREAASQLETASQPGSATDLERSATSTADAPWPGRQGPASAVMSEPTEPTRPQRAATVGAEAGAGAGAGATERLFSVDPVLQRKAMRSGSIRDKPVPAPASGKTRGE